MNAAEIAYARLVEAQHEYGELTDSQREFEARQLEQARNRDNRQRLIKRRMPKYF